MVTLTLSAERIIHRFYVPIIDDIKNFKYHLFAIKCQFSENSEVNLNIIILYMRMYIIMDKKIVSF